MQHFFSEKIILPLSDLLTGNSVAKSLKFLKSSQFWSKEEIKGYQLRQLQKLIIHSYSTVPYYFDLFNSINLKPDDIKSLNDLSKIPILTKSIIKKEGIERFTSTSIKKSKLISSSSSGSTGEPLFYYRTKEAYSMNIATSLRGWSWMGYEIGDKYIKLSQNPRSKLIKRIQDTFSRNRYLSTNPLNEENFNFILNSINDYKPDIIRCYPDPLYFLAQYKNSSKIKMTKLKAIATTGNTLFPNVRAEIEQAFDCKIFDSYSCEGNSNVFECPSHTCYHSAEEYGITEVVDESFQVLHNGIGTLISTDLCNLAHPFIRYNTQDQVEIINEDCICGRNLLPIKRILGRDNEVLTAKNGKRFIVHSFTGFFQQDTPLLNRSIDQFQIIKKKEGYVLFRLVVNGNFNEAIHKYIVDFWSEALGSPIKLEKLPEIPINDKNNKRRFIIIE